jgi:hypothetical protein
MIGVSQTLDLWNYYVNSIFLEDSWISLFVHQFINASTHETILYYWENWTNCCMNCSFILFFRQLSYSSTNIHAIRQTNKTMSDHVMESNRVHQETIDALALFTRRSRRQRRRQKDHYSALCSRKSVVSTLLGEW